MAAVIIRNEKLGLSYEVEREDFTHAHFDEDHTYSQAGFKIVSDAQGHPIAERAARAEPEPEAKKD